jgi:hypothetical protein
VRFQTVVVILLLILMVGCSKDFTNQPLPNQPPKTFLTIVPDSTLRSTTSQQHLHWWGVDPDGFVKGYYISFDSLHWTFTTSNDSVIGLRISTSDTTYKFFVAAVDDQGAIDPKPASLKYPIHNSPPVVSFVFQSDVPDTTYPVATFQWNGYDVDGNETVVGYYYALDDTTNPAKWKNLTSDNNRVTLYKSDGLTEGTHIFYLKARDVAGAYSKTIRMPIDTTKTWYVKEPKGDFLIIDDYGIADATASFYSQMFDTLMSGRLKAKDIWDIKDGYTSTTRGKYVPALITPTFTESIKLFKYILWYCDQNPQMDIAQSSIPAYKAAGGKILFVTGFLMYPADARGFGDFAPIDNIESSYFKSILLSKDSLVAVVDQTYPTLYRDANPAAYTFPRGLLPKGNARIIYQMGKSPFWASRDTTPIIMGVKDADQPSIVMLSILLHRFGGNPDGGIPNNVPAFLRKVYQNEFGVR